MIAEITTGGIVLKLLTGNTGGIVIAKLLSCFLKEKID
jgi:hypothetical protein